MNNEQFTAIVIPIIAAIGGGAVGAIFAFRFQYRTELKRERRYVLQNLMMYRNVGALELE